MSQRVFGVKKFAWMTSLSSVHSVNPRLGNSVKLYHAVIFSFAQSRDSVLFQPSCIGS